MGPRTYFTAAETRPVVRAENCSLRRWTKTGLVTTLAPPSRPHLRPADRSPRPLVPPEMKITVIPAPLSPMRVELSNIDQKNGSRPGRSKHDLVHPLGCGVGWGKNTPFTPFSGGGNVTGYGSIDAYAAQCLETITRGKSLLPCQTLFPSRTAP